MKSKNSGIRRGFMDKLKDHAGMDWEKLWKGTWSYWLMLRCQLSPQCLLIVKVPLSVVNITYLLILCPNQADFPHPVGTPVCFVGWNLLPYAHCACVAYSSAGILLFSGYPIPSALQQVSQMVKDVLELGRKCQYVFFPLLSAEMKRVAGCVGGKQSGNPAGDSRCNWESREESSGDNLGGLWGRRNKYDLVPHIVQLRDKSQKHQNSN